MLVWGLAALSATGGISGLQSSSLWVDNGDGTWYWFKWNGEPESFQKRLASLESALESFKTELAQKETILVEAEKNLEWNQENINVKNILSRISKKEESLNTYLALKNSSSVIDLYNCTNNALYKWKGYRYENPEAYDARYKELGEKITSLNKELNLEQVQATKKISEATTGTNTQITEITKAANEASVAPNKKIIELKKELTKAKPADKAKINAEILKLQAQLADLKKTTNNQIADLKAKLTALTTSTNNALKVSVKQYQDEIKKTQDEKTAMENNPKCVENARNSITSNQKIIDQLQAEIVTIKQELDVEKQKLAPKEAEIQGIKGEVEQLKTQIIKIEKNIESLKNPTTDGKQSEDDSEDESNDNDSETALCVSQNNQFTWRAQCGYYVGRCEENQVSTNLVQYGNVSYWNCHSVNYKGEICWKILCKSEWAKDITEVDIPSVCQKFSEQSYQGCTRQDSPCMINGDNSRYGTIADSYDCGGNIICTADSSKEICEGNGKACGDGTIDAPWGETCDDGNRLSWDGCSAVCGSELLSSFCGDGVIQNPNASNFSEQCDDGNKTDGDGCDQYCMEELKEGEGSTNI